VSRRGGAVAVVPVGGASEAAPEASAFGHVTRTCDSCGREWLPPQCACGGSIFTERAVEAAPMVVSGYLSVKKIATAVMRPFAPAGAHAADSGDLELLAELRDAFATVEAALPGADTALRRLVTADDRAAQRWYTPHAVVVQAVAPGDWGPSASQPVPLAHYARALRALLEDRLVDRDHDAAVARVAAPLAQALPTMAAESLARLAESLTYVALAAEPPAPADLAAVQALADSLGSLLAALSSADSAARRLANWATGVVADAGGTRAPEPLTRQADRFTFLQAVLAGTSNTVGDFDLAAAGPFSLALVSRGLRDLITRTLNAQEGLT